MSYESAQADTIEKLRAELAEAHAQVALLTEQLSACDGPHSCGEHCQRPGCVMRRDLLAARLRVIAFQADALNARVALRGLLKYGTPQDGDGDHADWRYFANRAQQVLDAPLP